jgi:predicted amidohydrolase
LTFLSAAIDLIRRRAWAAEGSDDLAHIDLAAHLFAVGCQLLLNEGNARLMARLDEAERPVPTYSLPEVRKQLIALPDEIGARELYQAIIAALVSIEAVLADTPSYLPGLPHWTDLEPRIEAGFRGVGGRVHHWFRPPSALAKIRSLRFENVRSRPPEPSPHPGIYLERLAFYWDSDFQLPGISRVPTDPSARSRIGRFVRTSGEDASLRGRFRIALCPLVGPFHPRFSIDSEGRFFQALRESSIEGAGELRRHLETVLEAADAEGARLVVFPELTIDPQTREHLQQELRRTQGQHSDLFGVIAGSFHVWPAGASSKDDPPVNESVLLDRAGAPVMIHRKRGRFRVPGSQVNDRFFPRKPEKISREVYEDIRYGSELQIFETSLGRLAILICADAIAADDRGYLPLIRRLRPDLLLVVSMTPETELFDAFADEMSRHWIGTIFVNAHCICHQRGVRTGLLESWLRRLFIRPQPRPSEGVNLAAWDLALFETEHSPPTRARWRTGTPEPECFYFKPESGPKGWRPLSQAPGKTGISLLRKGDETLGLLLDLGVHWRTGVE